MSVLYRHVPTSQLPMSFLVKLLVHSPGGSNHVISSCCYCLLLLRLFNGQLPPPGDRWCCHERLSALLILICAQCCRRPSALATQRWFSWSFSGETTSKRPLLWEEYLSCWQRSERFHLLSYIFFLFFYEYHLVVFTYKGNRERLSLFSTVSRLLHGNEVGIHQLE